MSRTRISLTLMATMALLAGCTTTNPANTQSAQPVAQTQPVKQAPVKAQATAQQAQQAQAAKATQARQQVLDSLVAHYQSAIKTGTYQQSLPQLPANLEADAKICAEKMAQRNVDAAIQSCLKAAPYSVPAYRNVAVALMNGTKTIKADPARAHKILEFTASELDGQSVYYLAQLYLKGNQFGYPRNIQTATKLAEIAGQLGYPVGYITAGEILVKQQKLQEAFNVFDQACKAGMKQGCSYQQQILNFVKEQQAKAKAKK